MCGLASPPASYVLTPACVDMHPCWQCRPIVRRANDLHEMYKYTCHEAVKFSCSDGEVQLQ